MERKRADTQVHPYVDQGASVVIALNAIIRTGPALFERANEPEVRY